MTRAGNRARDERGVTLIELVLAVALLSIIAVPLSSAFIVGFRVTAQANAELNDGNASELVSLYFPKDVQNTNPANPVAQNATDCSGATGTTIFHQSDGTDVSYVVESSNGTRLVRRGPTCKKQVVGPGLSSGSIHLYCTDGTAWVSGCPLKTGTVDLTTTNGYHTQLKVTTRP